MPEKCPKRPRDPAQLAKLMIDIASGEVEDREPTDIGKNETRRLAGRKGGLAGGKARASKMTAEQRRQIARKAAQKRWTKDS